MGVGADDYIDKMLVQKYQEERVDNHDNMESMVDPNKMLEAMNDYAATVRNMMELRQRLNIACYAIKQSNITTTLCQSTKAEAKRWQIDAVFVQSTIDLYI